MKFVTINERVKLPAVGLGTWSMGGGMSAVHSRDRQALAALHTALDLGYTHIDTAEMYASGHTEELIGQAIQGRDRAQLFITTKVSPSHLRPKDLQRSLDGSLRRLGTDYIDLYLIHWPSHSIPLAEPFPVLNQAVQAGKIRHLGVSNFGLKLLQEAQQLCETPIITNQIPYSMFTRRYRENGVVSYCQENSISITAYSPLKDGGIRSQATIRQIGERHGATPYQVALAWLVCQPMVLTIPMSENPQHLAANLAAADIHLTDEEMAQLDQLA
ncbi:MAG: aldo/keto reductase [Anaerolineales bacterium]